MGVKRELPQGPFICPWCAEKLSSPPRFYEYCPKREADELAAIRAKRRYAEPKPVEPET